MFLRKTPVAVISFLIACQFANAQHRPLEKSLLWTISGNGMKKPSYLFGTMHLQDKRLFRFPDSLYAFIKQSDRFYMEVDPQEAVMYVLNEMARPDSSPLLSRVMDKETFDKRSAALEKELGIPANKITRKQAFLHRMRKESMLGKKDMETAMDLWLYNLAKKQGKTVGGIENVRDQMKLFMEAGEDDFLFTSAEKQMETMIRTYLDEDLEMLYSFVAAMPEADRIAFLDKRNVTMKNAIDSISKLGSGFFAVGAAHLPGEEGVINLLRKVGYTVTPVFTKKRIAAADYKYEALTLPWLTVMDKDSLFAVDMPEAASEFNIFGDMLPLKGTIDMSTGIFYQAGHTQAYAVNARDSFVRKMAERMNVNNSTWKKTAYAGKTTYDFNTKSQEGYTYRIRIIDNANSYIILLAGSEKEKQLSHPDVDRYMNSVKVLRELPVIAAGSEWYKFSDSANGFALLFPGKPSEIPAVTASLKNQDAEGWDFFSTTFIDNSNQVYYMLFSKKTQKGYFIQDPRAILADIAKAVEDNPRYKNVKTDTGSYKGYPAMWLSGDDVTTGFKMWSMQMVRDNRNLSLIMIGTEHSLTENLTSKFFNSLEFLPYQHDKWTTQKVEAANFEVYAPGMMEATDTSNDEPGITYSAYDRLINSGYSVDVYPVQKYFWTNSDSAFYAYETNLLVHEGDSVLAQRRIVNGGLPGMEVDIWKTSTFCRYRIIRNGNEVFFVYVHGSPAYVKEHTAAFLESFRVLKTKKDDSIYISKAAMLLRDLTSSDSSVAEAAQMFLPSAPFTKADLPLLHQAILDDEKYEKADYNNTYFNLVNHIATLADPSTTVFIKENFSGMNEKELGYEALNLLAKMQTDNSFKQLKELLLTVPVIHGDHSAFQMQLGDSLELTAKLFPDVLPLLTDSLKSELLIPVIQRQIENGLLDSTLLRAYLKPLLSIMENSLSEAHGDDDFWKYHSWFLLLQQLPDHAADDLIMRSQTYPSLSVKYLAVRTALRMKLPVSKPAVDKLASEDYYRWDLYSILKELGKLSLFPKSQLTQRLFFQARLANYVADDYGVPKIQFVGERFRMAEGKKRRFYIYKVLVEDREPMLGIAGGLLMNETGADIEPDFLEVFEDFNSATIDSQLDNMVSPPPTVEEMDK